MRGSAARGRAERARCRAGWGRTPGVGEAVADRKAAAEADMGAAAGRRRGAEAGRRAWAVKGPAREGRLGSLITMGTVGARVGEAAGGDVGSAENSREREAKLSRCLGKTRSERRMSAKTHLEGWIGVRSTAASTCSPQGHLSSGHGMEEKIGNVAMRQWPVADTACCEILAGSTNQSAESEGTAVQIGRFDFSICKSNQAQVWRLGEWSFSNPL